jgi:hypothetical protein
MRRFSPTALSWGKKEMFMPSKVKGEVKRVKPTSKGRTGKIKKDPNLAEGERSQNALYEKDAKRKQKESKKSPQIADDRTVD